MMPRTPSFTSTSNPVMMGSIPEQHFDRPIKMIHCCHLQRLASSQSLSMSYWNQNRRLILSLQESLKDIDEKRRRAYNQHCCGSSIETDIMVEGISKFLFPVNFQILKNSPPLLG